MQHQTVPQSTDGDLIATAKTARPVGDLFTVSGEHGRVSYDQFANRVELVDAYGDIEAMGKRWSDQVAQVVEAGDDEAVFALLAEHYRTELAGGAR